jgi:CheY-like chemotaxis protein
VLVVDDDARVREALALLLRRAGADVELAESASEARAHIARCAPEVVVCDLAMPHEDGYDFIRTLRASGSSIAAIALSAHATETDIHRALAAGFDRHLAKPIELAHLVANIDNLLVATRTNE